MNNWNVTPDILVTAKGITSAYMPLGLCATNGKIAAHFRRPPLRARPHL